MGTFEEFVESEAFFPILIFLLVILVSVFAWIMLSGNKKDKVSKKKIIKNIEDRQEIKILQEETKVNEAETVENVETVEENIVKEDAFNDMVIEENVISTETVMPVVEENVVTSEVANDNQYMEENNIVEDLDTNIISDDVVPFKEENIEYTKPEIEETDNLAFGHAPEFDQTINENITVEEKEEKFNKTEIFDFPDFNDVNIDFNKSAEEYDEDVLAEANKYIESIMSKQDK